MIGILSKDSINSVGHGLFQNFRLAIKNYFQQDLKEVNGSSDLTGIDMFIIVDEHYNPHTKVWKGDGFIQKLNTLNIKTLVFNFEKIFNSPWPWNIDHQKKLEQIKNLIQIVSDIDDARILNKPIINKQLLSRDTVLIEPQLPKNNAAIFAGQCNSYYPTRQKNIIEFKTTGYEFDINITSRKLTYTDFLQTLNMYKFVFNPLGTGKFINLRFYEALKLGCIPIQEITPDMKDKYPELDFCIPFYAPKDVTVLQLQSQMFKPFNYYLEDYFSDINLSNLVS